MINIPQKEKTNFLFPSAILKFTHEKKNRAQSSRKMRKKAVEIL